MDEKKLTEDEAFLAMYAYIEGLYKLTGMDYLGGLLGDMSLLDDGTTADPAVRYDWETALEKVRRGEVDARLRFDNETDRH